jgi:transposase
MTTRDIRSLPDDPAALKELLIEECRRGELLKHRLAQLLRRAYGSSSEKRPSGQELFDFAEEAGAPLEALPDPRAAKRERKKPGGRKPLPGHWPCERRVHDLPEAEKVCSGCDEPLRKIGEEISEEIEVVPARYKVIEHMRPKYACPRCREGVKIAALPERMLEKGRPGASLIAQVVTDKYAWHLPLYRQSEMFGSQGWEVSRALLCAWTGVAAERLRPIAEFMRADVLHAPKLHTDDTPVRVLEPGRGKTRTARFWTYVGHGEHAHVVFDYTPSRARDGPVDFLGDYEGYLQADAFTGYDAIYAGKKVIEVACWAHARRKFVEARATDARADEMLEWIGRMYAVEDEVRDRPAAVRREARQLKTVPLLDRIDAWLVEHWTDPLPKSPLGQAIRYTRNQWKALNRFVEDGLLEPDNNIAENALRCVALGRKNWLFVGNDAAGGRAAILYSLVASCRHHGIDPYGYIEDVLRRVDTHPARRVSELAPLNWKRIFRPRRQAEDPPRAAAQAVTTDL